MFPAVSNSVAVYADRGANISFNLTNIQMYINYGGPNVP
jgi:hypothetical protein